MGVLNKIIVGLDLSDFDKRVLAYLKEFNKTARPEKIVFLNALEESELSQDLLKKFPDLKSTVTENQLEKMVQACGDFNFVGTELKYKVVEGEPLKVLMKTAKGVDADLIIVGKKKISDKSISHVKLTRSSYCDVLLVTETANPIVKTLLVATDFSEYSKDALNKAIELADKLNAKIILQHVYSVPTGYSKTGKSYEEFADIMKSNAESDYKKFISGVDTKGIEIEPLFTLSDSDDTHEHIVNAAAAAKADLIVVGAKGRTNFTAILVGSTTEKLIAHPSAPIYVVKKKGSEFGLLDALFD